MTKLNLKELREKAEKATPGEWKISLDGTNLVEIYSGGHPHFPEHLIVHYTDSEGSSFERKEDREYCAYANPQTILTLITALETAVEAIKIMAHTFPEPVEIIPHHPQDAKFARLAEMLHEHVFGSAREALTKIQEMIDV